MEIIVNISDSTGIKRKARVRHFGWRLEDGDEAFTIKVEILRFLNDSGAYGAIIPPSKEYPSFREEFTASDLVRIDPETGEIIDTVDLSVGVGEYTATLSKVNEIYPELSPLQVVIGLIIQSVQQADQRGRFNNLAQ